MSAFVVTWRSRRMPVVILLAALVAPIALSGCGTSSKTYANSQATSVLSWKLADQDQPRRGSPPGQRVEMEDDGVPVQTAPSLGTRHAKDDPSQPWSPNYGRDLDVVGTTAPAPGFEPDQSPTVAPAAQIPPLRSKSRPVLSRVIRPLPLAYRVAEQSDE